MAHLPAVLAVDGGNSKTDLALIADDGTVLGTVRWTGTSHQILGLRPAITALGAAVDQLCQVSGIPIQRPVARLGALCLAGLDLPVDDRRVGRALEAEGFARRLLLRNDTFAVLRAGTRRPWGVAAVCGAGMNCVGQAPDGRWVRFPALGALSGDWAGGGGWLGLRALGAAIRCDDGRGIPTQLRDRVPAHFGLPDPAAVMEAIYTGVLPERRLVELGPTVWQAARDGDEVALGMLLELADELVAMVRATIVRLGIAHLEVPVVLGGGLLQAPEGPVLDHLRTCILDVAGRAELSMLRPPPLLGAALLGLDAIGVTATGGTAATGGVTGTGGVKGTGGVTGTGGAAATDVVERAVTSALRDFPASHLNVQPTIGLEP